MSIQHGDRADDTLDLVEESVRRMERYYAPGGLFEAQQRRVQNDQVPRPLQPLEIYEGEFVVKIVVERGNLFQATH